jgi:Stage II sporulation protein E (SpoIIE)/Plasmid pRiA4b ORF-3-like protein
MADALGGEAYRIHVWIRQISPMIWRRLLVGSDSSIADLHHTLQIAFGWSDSSPSVPHPRPGLRHRQDRRVGFSTDAKQVRLGDLHLPDGRVVLSIGDVAGSGLEAAVTMASVRQSIRTAALINPDPVRVLDAVDRIVRAMTHDRFVTAWVAVFDPVCCELVFANAGHPPPLVRYAGGSIAELAYGRSRRARRERSFAPADVCRRVRLCRGGVLVSAPAAAPLGGRPVAPSC